MPRSAAMLHLSRRYWKCALQRHSIVYDDMKEIRIGGVRIVIDKNVPTLLENSF
jgi:hypothetical protein